MIGTNSFSTCFKENPFSDLCWPWLLGADCFRGSNSWQFADIDHPCASVQYVSDRMRSTGGSVLISLNKDGGFKIGLGGFLAELSSLSSS